MKKLLLAVMVIAGLAGSAFATDVNKVSDKAQSNFETRFANAQNVTWTVKDIYTKASFTLVGEQVEAFFGTDGDMIGFSRKVELKNLPLNAIQNIKKNYADYSVKEAIEFEHNDEKAFYVSLENGNKKLILEVSLYGNVSVSRGAKK